MSRRMLLLTEDDLRRLVTLDMGVVDCVQAAFAALATQAVAMPPVLRLDIPEHRGEVDVKTAYVGRPAGGTRATGCATRLTTTTKALR